MTTGRGRPPVLRPGGQLRVAVSRSLLRVLVGNNTWTSLGTEVVFLRSVVSEESYYRTFYILSFGTPID